MKENFSIEHFRRSLASKDYSKESKILHQRQSRPSQSGNSSTLKNHDADQTSKKFLNTNYGLRQSTIFWPIGLFLILLCLPLYLTIGTIRLPPYRIFLLIAILPCLYRWATSKYLNRSLTDTLVLLYVFWAAVTIFVNQPMSRSVEAAGSLVVDTAGSYFLARAMITNPVIFRRCCKTLFILVSIMGLFGFFEGISGRNLVSQTFGSLFTVFPANLQETRFGINRAQGSFEHAILYGVFCSAAFSLTFYILRARSSYFQFLTKMLMVLAATFFSLSGGAYISIAAQIIFILWDKLVTFTRQRWRILCGFAILTYLVIDALSNRSPFEVFVTYFTFDQHSSYNRILIWHFGITEVFRHPIFGMGIFDDWVRPDWMVASIDNFWLLRTMRHGILGGFLLVMTVVSVIVKLSRAYIIDKEVDACRRGILSTIGGLCVALMTVDLWSATYCVFLFLLGASVWITSNTTIKRI